MRSHLPLIQVILLLFCILVAVEARGDAPEAPAAEIELPFFENGFEDFVGCGDGVAIGEEQCDDQNQNDGDGCNSTCNIEIGFICNGQPSVCTTYCGDGSIVGAEQCDDLNQNPGDGCDASCNIEIGFICNGQPSVCTTLCGDGSIVGAEQCDDANLLNGDGCNTNCQVENGFMCANEPSVCSQIP